MKNKQVSAEAAIESRKSRWTGYCVSWFMILPAMFFLIAFVVYPAFNMMYLSLFRGNAVNPTRQFIGLANYNRLFFVKDDFMVALWNTTSYVMGALAVTMVFSVLLAQWLSRPTRINNTGKVLFFTPHIVASVSAGFVWAWLLSSQTYGFFNYILGMFGLPAVKWLDNSSTAMMCIVIMNSWKSVGYYALIVLSAMKSIPEEIYEAARLDYASKTKIFFKITLPMISPQLFFMLITITTGSFKVFDSIRVMTNGGPGDATRVISMYIYDYAFQRNNTLGYACAAGTVLMFIMVIITFIDFAFVEKKVHYQ